MAVLKVETDIIASIVATIDNVCRDLQNWHYYQWHHNVFDVTLTGNFQYHSHFLPMPVTNWPSYILVDQGQFSDPHYISGTHQKKNVQFAYKEKYFSMDNICLWFVHNCS